jgi:hypothetical protein
MRTVEERLDFIEKQMVNTNDVLIQHGENIIKLINEIKDIYELIDKTDASNVELINKCSATLVKLSANQLELTERINSMEIK